jgi:hypothetical protein
VTGVNSQLLSKIALIPFIGIKSLSKKISKNHISILKLTKKKSNSHIVVTCEKEHPYFMGFLLFIDIFRYFLYKYILNQYIFKLL